MGQSLHQLGGCEIFIVHTNGSWLMLVSVVHQHVVTHHVKDTFASPAHTYMLL